MIRHGIAPFIECSSRGERRLSAFAARLRRHSNRSIEDIYQAGRCSRTAAPACRGATPRATSRSTPPTPARCTPFVWDEYIAENPALLRVIVEASGLRDMFGQPGHCCQATELWRIRCAALSHGSEPCR